MFLKILKYYLITFVILFVTYTFVNIHFLYQIQNVDFIEKYSNNWIPLFVSLIISYVIFKPLIKKSNFKVRVRDQFWLFISISFWVPIMASQDYFKSANYSIVNVLDPSEILKHEGELFFNIKNYYVTVNKYSEYREHHSSMVRSHRLYVNYYFVTPIFADSNHLESFSSIFFGIHYSTSMSNSVFTNKDNQHERINNFKHKSYTDYYKYDFQKDGYFEVERNTEDAYYYRKAALINNIIKSEARPIVLIHREGSFDKLKTKRFNMFFYSTLISISLFIVILYFCEKNKEKMSAL